MFLPPPPPTHTISACFAKELLLREGGGGMGVGEQLGSKQETRHPGSVGHERVMFFPRPNRGVSHWERRE